MERGWEGEGEEGWEGEGEREGGEGVGVSPHSAWPPVVRTGIRRER